MRLPRFRIRTLMVVVAVAAIGLAVLIERERERRLSSEYSFRAVNHRQLLLAVRSHLLTGERLREWDDYHRAMAKKWQWASEHPWWPVEPDPPEPK